MRVLLVCMFAAGAWAQAASTVTITAQRTLNFPPDQVTLAITVSAPETAAPDAFLSLLAGTGAAIENLVSTYGAHGNLNWEFDVPVRIPALNGVLAALVADQKQSKRGGLFSIDFSIYPRSAPLQNCPYTALFSDARSQALQVAGAAGLRIGRLLTLSDGNGQQAPVAIYAQFQVVGSFTAFLNAPRPAASPCVLVAQFELLPL